MPEPARNARQPFLVPSVHAVNVRVLQAEPGGDQPGTAIRLEQLLESRGPSDMLQFVSHSRVSRRAENAGARRPPGESRKQGALPASMPFASASYRCCAPTADRDAVTAAALLPPGVRMFADVRWFCPGSEALRPRSTPG